MKCVNHLLKIKATMYLNVSPVAGMLYLLTPVFTMVATNFMSGANTGGFGIAKYSSPILVFTI